MSANPLARHTDRADLADRPPARRAEMLAQVAAALCRSYEEHFGRSPDSAAAAFNGGDAIVVTAQGVLTDTERSYTTRADHLRLRECRTLFQYVNPAPFCDPIERITGRRVRALVSGIAVCEDVATETFILESERSA